MYIMCNLIPAEVLVPILWHFEGWCSIMYVSFYVFPVNILDFFFFKILPYLFNCAHSVSLCVNEMVVVVCKTSVFNM